MEKQQTKSQEILEKAGIAVRLSLAEKIIGEDGRPKGTRSTGEHKVKFLEDKVVKGKDFQTGVERLEMKYFFEEDGQKKFYAKPLRDDDGEVNYFIQRMAAFNYGDELILKYVSKGLRGYIDVSLANSSEKEGNTPTEVVLGATDDFKEVDGDDIPIVEDDDIKLEDIPF